MEVINGTIRKVNFYNPDTGFYLASLTNTGQGSITIKGNMVKPLTIGTMVKVSGYFTDDPKYGRQFHFDHIDIIDVDPYMGIKGYLASPRFKGIGESLSNALVEKYGDQTLQRIKNGMVETIGLRGLTKAKLQRLIKTIRKYDQENEIFIFLMQYGLTFNQVSRIIKRYGVTTLSKVSDDPYVLMQIDGFGFFQCDAIAQKLGLPLDDPSRLANGLIQSLNEQGNQKGNTWVDETTLIDSASKLLGVDGSLLVQPLDLLVSSKKIIRYPKSEHIGYMLKIDHEHECLIAKRITQLLHAKRAPLKNGQKALEDYIYSLSFQLDDSQLVCIKAAMIQPVMILTGGPGTGKTTIVKGIVNVLSKLGLSVQLCAPTGKAAKRMSEAVGEEAMTIHRLLECYFDQKSGKPRFKRNKNHPLQTQVLIVDECSMMDALIAAKLLDACATKIRLILVGDVDQLPSVGAGNVFADLIDSHQIPVYRLTMIHRQKQTSYIPTNAALIIQGKLPILLPNGNQTDFWFVQVDDPKDIHTQLIMMVKRLLRLDKIKPEMIQVLTPLKKGENGSIALNEQLAQLFNRDRDPNQSIHGLSIHDRVIQTTNNYDMTLYGANHKPISEGIFNGDMGVIDGVDMESKTIIVHFNDDRYGSYQYDAIDQLDLAYALTVHKSQGSEFDIVIMPLTTGYPMIINRRLFYTAVTRAKKMMIVVSTMEYLRETIANNQISLRQTILPTLL